MRPERFREIVEGMEFATSNHPNDIGMSAFARWLPCNLRTAARWASGECEVPSHIAKLLLAMETTELDPNDITRLEEVEEVTRLK